MGGGGGTIFEGPRPTWYPPEFPWPPPGYPNPNQKPDDEKPTDTPTDEDVDPDGPFWDEDEARTTGGWPETWSWEAIKNAIRNGHATYEDWLNRDGQFPGDRDNPDQGPGGPARKPSDRGNTSPMGGNQA